MVKGFEDWTVEDVLKHNASVKGVTDIGKINNVEELKATMTTNNTTKNKKNMILNAYHLAIN